MYVIHRILSERGKAVRAETLVDEETRRVMGTMGRKRLRTTDQRQRQDANACLKVLREGAAPLAAKVHRKEQLTEDERPRLEQINQEIIDLKKTKKTGVPKEKREEDQ